MSEPTCIWKAEAQLGEGPLWVAQENAVLWVDIRAKRLHRYGVTDHSRQSWQFTTEVTSIAAKRSGGFIGTLRHGFANISLPSGQLEPLLDVESHLPYNRFNDGKPDHSGRYWAGSMDDSESEATGNLYRLDPDLQIRQMDSHYVISNGPAFSRDNSRLYHTDTLKRVIYSFDLAEDGSLSNKREFVRLPEEQGYPDGMTVDSEDCLWVCHFGGWRITRFSPAGEALEVIPMPVANITSCTFGGESLDTLFITTARKNISDAQLVDQPLAGGLFCFQPGVKGLPTPLFAG